MIDQDAGYTDSLVGDNLNQLQHCNSFNRRCIVKNKNTTLLALILASISITATAGDLSGPWLDVYRAPSVSATSSILPGAIAPKKNYKGTKVL
ncbi:MAG: hypothetical protein LUO80_11320, partial [Methylococcaceae bacterium]|nr:hypothetical protein [Methylococcaceae bacterium]